MFWDWFLFTFGGLVAAVVVSELFLFILNRVVKPFASKTKTTLDDHLLKSLGLPVRLFGIIVGLYFVAASVSPSLLVLGNDLGFWWITLLIAWGGFLSARITSAVIKWYADELPYAEGRGSSKINKTSIPLLRRLASTFIYLLALIIILHRFGVEITPLITALGIGGLAVALALRDTLSNFFAGLYLITDKPIRAGDYIAVGDENSAVKAFVVEVGWRTTTLRTRGNNTYYIPNEKIIADKIVNFSRGQATNWKGASLTFGVSSAAEIDEVKKIVASSFNELKKRDAHSRLQSDEVTVRLEDVKGNSLVFRVLFKVSNYFEADEVAADFREQIVRDLKKKGIALA